MKSFQIFLFKYLVRVSSRPELGFLGRIIRRKKFIKKIKPGQQIEVWGGDVWEQLLSYMSLSWPLASAFIAFALTPPYLRWIAWLRGISMREGWKLTQTLVRGRANLPVRRPSGKNNNYQSENKYPAIN